MILSTIRMSLLLFLTVLLTLLANASQAVQNLDLSFGNKGVVITDFGIADDEVSALAVQADGKVLVAGFSSNSVVKDIAVARYLGDGTLDTSFHTSGYLTFNVGDGNAVAKAMAVQEDGNIVIAGTSDNGSNETSSEIFLTRLTSTGYIDITFGVDGKLVLPLKGASEAKAYDLKIDADGDILVAGTAREAGKLATIVACVDPHGVVDGKFGSDGIASIARDYETAAHALVVQKDETILLAGYSRPNDTATLSIFRLQAGGDIDETFGSKGEVQVAVPGGDAVIYDMAVQADGRLIVVGSFDNGSYREVLLGRFLPDGKLDTAFGSEGMVRNDMGYDSVGYALAAQEDGSLLATGFSETAEGKDIILLRYGITGSEAVTEDTQAAIVASSTDSAENLSAQSQAKTTPASNSDTDVSAESSGSAEKFPATATYLVVSVSKYDDESFALQVLADGRALAAGYAGNGDDSDFVLLKFNSAAVELLAASATGAGGVANDNYYITTTSITNITRNSAMSGGSITERATQKNCVGDCEAECAGEVDAAYTTCYDACSEECHSSAALTVTARGVCYGTARHPVYRATTGETDTTTTTTTTGGTTTDSTSILPASAKETAYNYETVLYGQTSDGTGLGSYGSNIVNITPGTVYYLRAYAVLSDETVIYGNELSFETSDACFIATAAYGSMLHSHVVVLRKFRDVYLKNNDLGRRFAGLYYRFSPKIAEVIEDNAALRQVVRIWLWPWVAFSYIMLNLAGAAKITLVLMGGLIVAIVLRSMITIKSTNR